MLIGRWKSKDKGSSKSSSGSGGAGKKKRKFGREGKDERESLTSRFFNDGLRNARLNVSARCASFIRFRRIRLRVTLLSFVGPRALSVVL